MRRHDLWPSRLSAVLADAEARPFEWGPNDCCSFADRCVEAVTGKRLWPVEAPAYTTAAGAYKALATCGYGSIEDALDALLGERKPLPFARRGDLVLLPAVTGMQGCGVIDLTGEYAVGVSPDGLVRHPLANASAAWAVG